jgi:hypothetical protein
MGTDSGEKVSTDNESDKLPPHQFSSQSEESGNDEEEEHESGTLQTRSNRNVSAVLPFTDRLLGWQLQIWQAVPPPWNLRSFFNIFCW